MSRRKKMNWRFLRKPPSTEAEDFPDVLCGLGVSFLWGAASTAVLPPRGNSANKRLLISERGACLPSSILFMTASHFPGFFTRGGFVFAASASLNKEKTTLNFL
jgi:hypothetical protein